MKDIDESYVCSYTTIFPLVFTKFEPFKNERNFQEDEFPLTSMMTSAKM